MNDYVRWAFDKDLILMFGQDMMSAGNQTGAYATSISRSADMTE